MTLVFDIGNTNINAGVFKGDRLLFEFRMPSDASIGAPRYCAMIRSSLKKKRVATGAILGSIIGSVVPRLTKKIYSAAKKCLKLKPLLITPKTKLNFLNMYKNKSEVGDDRIANAAAACAFFPGRDVAVVDFGTAATVDVITRKGRYLGGIIMPGLALSVQSLYAKTARLPQVELRMPKRIIGNSTKAAIQSGVMNSAVASATAIIEGIRKELRSKSLRVILTGGQSRKEVFSALTRKGAAIDNAFTLKGFNIIYHLNQL